MYPPASVAARDIPSPPDTAGRPTASGGALSQAAVERKVKPGLVDITAALKYQSETAEGTGMILSASGLVLTNNHVIDGATEVRASRERAESPSTGVICSLASSRARKGAPIRTALSEWPTA